MSALELNCRQLIPGSEDYQRSVELRFDVLRKPLGLRFTAQELEAERVDFHLGCYRGGELAGCLILVPVADHRVKMRQVAVAAHAQRQGIGRALVACAEAFARAREFHEITLHARESAVPFYEKLDYQRCGDRFEEVGLPHWKMQKKL